MKHLYKQTFFNLHVYSVCLTILVMAVGLRAQAPGGVSSGLRIWLKADAGTSSTTDSTAISAWNDASNANNNVSQSNSSRQPLFKDNPADNINFNPVVYFPGSHFLSDADGMLFTSGSAYANCFFIANAHTVKESFIFRENTTQNYTGLRLTDNAGTVWWDGAYTNRCGTAFNSQINTPLLWSGFNSNVKTPKSELFINGKYVSANPSINVWYTGQSSPFYIGSDGSLSRSFKGTIGEFIFAIPNLGATNKTKIETYLAIKYGISLYEGSPENYLATNGSVIWNANFNSSYFKNVVGIGRDDAEALYQKQSKSENTGNQLLLGLGTMAASNALNSHSFSGDRQYVICGDNGLSDAINSSLLSGNKMNRVWKAQVTNFSDSVRLAYPASAFSNSLTDKYLIRSSDSSFSGSYDRLPLSQFTLPGTSTVYYYADIDLQDGDFFTFAELNCRYPVITPFNTVHLVTNTGTCNVDGWLYYKHPSDPTSSVVAIHPNGNTWNPDTVMVDNSMAGTHIHSDGTYTTKLSERMITIVAPGTYSVNGGVKVKIYYTSSDTNNLPTITRDWFKHPGKKANVLADLKPKGLENCEIIYPDTFGNENGVLFVVFDSITSFSTFGFGGTTNVVALPVKISKFDVQKSGNEALVQWSVHTDNGQPTEQVLQRSSDGYNWIDIYTIRTSGQELLESYSYLDENCDKPNSFYRLKLSSVEEPEFYSVVRMLNWATPISNIQISPNPGTGLFNLDFGDLEGSSMNIQLISSNGQILEELKDIKTGAARMDLSAYTPGIYWVRVYNEEHSWLDKIILVNH